MIAFANQGQDKRAVKRASPLLSKEELFKDQTSSHK